MIHKAAEYKHGYVLGPSSCDKDLQELFNTYGEVKCLICNSKTARVFTRGIWGNNILTINNKISDGCFFINHTF